MYRYLWIGLWEYTKNQQIVPPPPFDWAEQCLAMIFFTRWMSESIQHWVWFTSH